MDRLFCPICLSTLIKPVEGVSSMVAKTPASTRQVFNAQLYQCTEWHLFAVFGNQQNEQLWRS
jgi:hypothetical protein